MIKKIKNLLLQDEKGDELVKKLLLHGCYLLVFELLKNRMDGFLRYFFCDSYDCSENKMSPGVMEPIKNNMENKNVRNLFVNKDGVSLPPSFIKLTDKKRLKKHYPKLAKLFDGDKPFINEQIEEMVLLGAFTRQEGNLLKTRYKSLRNDVGHRLFQMLISDDLEEITLENVAFIWKMYAKLDKWIFLFEIEINPEAYQKFSASELEAGQSVEKDILEIILNKMGVF